MEPLEQLLLTLLFQLKEGTAFTLEGWEEARLNYSFLEFRTERKLTRDDVLGAAQRLAELGYMREIELSDGRFVIVRLPEARWPEGVQPIDMPPGELSLRPINVERREIEKGLRTPVGVVAIRRLMRDDKTYVWSKTDYRRFISSLSGDDPTDPIEPNEKDRPVDAPTGTTTR